MDQTGKDPRNYTKKEKIKGKALSYAISAINKGISSQNVQILIN